MSKTLKVNMKGGDDKFKQFIVDEKQPCLALFLMDGCGHCEELKPKWEILKEKLNNTPSISLVVAEIKSDKSDEISNMIHTSIPGFPSIVAIKDGKAVEQFQGEREVDNIMKFVKKHFGKKGGRRKTRKRRSRKKTHKKRSQRRKKTRKRRRNYRTNRRVKKRKKKTRKKRGSGGVFSSCKKGRKNSNIESNMEECFNENYSFMKSEGRLNRNDPDNVKRVTPPPDMTSQYTRLIIKMIKKQIYPSKLNIEDETKIRNKMREMLLILSDEKWRELTESKGIEQQKILRTLWNKNK
tara:strand:- start:165 stop:1049 length:885 start_codon:yes stop_codon:yes gene_type:complete